MTFPIHPAVLAGKSGASSAIDRQITEKAREFEAVMLGQFVKTMTAGLGADGPTGGGNAERQWRDVLAQEYGKAIANAGGIGIAAQVERAMREGLPETGPHPAEAPPREQKERT